MGSKRKRATNGRSYKRLGTLQEDSTGLHASVRTGSQ